MHVFLCLTLLSSSTSWTHLRAKTLWSLPVLIAASSGLALNHSDFADARALFQSQPKEEQSRIMLTPKPPNEIKPMEATHRKGDSQVGNQWTLREWDWSQTSSHKRNIGISLPTSENQRDLLCLLHMRGFKDRKGRFIVWDFCWKPCLSHEVTCLACQPNMIDYVIVSYLGSLPCKAIAHPSPFPGDL